MSTNAERGIFPWSKSREPEAPWSNDREMDFRVGQLVGACIMAAHVLSLSEDESAKAIAQRLAERAAWFEAPVAMRVGKALERSPTAAGKP